MEPESTFSDVELSRLVRAWRGVGRELVAVVCRAADRTGVEAWRALAEAAAGLLHLCEAPSSRAASETAVDSVIALLGILSVMDVAREAIEGQGLEDWATSETASIAAFFGEALLAARGEAVPEARRAVVRAFVDALPADGALALRSVPDAIREAERHDDPSRRVTGALGLPVGRGSA